MEANIVIALVVCVVIAAHIVLYRWVKFKMDEGVILKFLQQGQNTWCSSQVISSSTGITADRVTAVCSKSSAFDKNTVETESWCLHQANQGDSTA